MADVPAAPTGAEDDETATDIFPTTVLSTRLPEAEALNAALKSAILQRRAEDPGQSGSGVGGWRSEADMLSWGGEAAQTLARRALRLCGRRTRDLNQGDGPPRFSWSIEMWANVSPPGGLNDLHSHPGAFWSAVYYVDTGAPTPEAEGGRLYFQDPAYPLNRTYAPELAIVTASGRLQATRKTLTPEAGRLVAFPSWLLHGVEPHRGDGERISIAMNLAVRPAA